MKEVSITLLLMFALCEIASGQNSQNPKSTKTQVVMLGTGTPGAGPDRSGPATAIVVTDTSYLVYFGAGVVVPRVHKSIALTSADFSEN